MKSPFVSRRRYAAEVSSLRSQYEALRERCAGAESREATERYARCTITSQFEEADEARTALTLVNVRLTEDLTAVKEELAEARALLTESAATRFQAEARREKKRADRLQKQYDDAVGLGGVGIRDSSGWQPAHRTPKTDPKQATT